MEMAWRTCVERVETLPHDVQSLAARHELMSPRNRQRRRQALISGSLGHAYPHAQINAFSMTSMLKTRNVTAYRTGGSARGYQAIFVPSTALASPGYDGQPAVYFIHHRP